MGFGGLFRWNCWFFWENRRKILLRLEALPIKCRVIVQLCRFGTTWTEFEKSSALTIIETETRPTCDYHLTHYTLLKFTSNIPPPNSHQIHMPSLHQPESQYHQHLESSANISVHPLAARQASTGQTMNHASLVPHVLSRLDGAWQLSSCCVQMLVHAKGWGGIRWGGTRTRENYRDALLSHF